MIANESWMKPEGSTAPRLAGKAMRCQSCSLRRVPSATHGVASRLSVSTLHASRTSRLPRIGFTLTELLVVIGIIVLLASILLVALGQVRAKAQETSTTATMRSFAAAADAFQQEHGQYPGVIPERILAQAIALGDVQIDGTDDGGTSQTWNGGFSSTENALLHMMGGYRVLRPNASTKESEEFDQFDVDGIIEITIGTDSEWKLRVDVSRIGEGPVIDGRAYAPYFTPGSREIGAVEGRVDANGEFVTHRIPTLIDAWGQPILYTRRMRSSGPLVGEPNPDDSMYRPQFALEGLFAYLRSPQLGERGENQLIGMSVSGSILTVDDVAERHEIFAQLLRHPSFGPTGENPLDDKMMWDRFAPRGEYVLISAGRDGIYFSAIDGPGSGSAPLFGDEVNSMGLNELREFGPTIFQEFDDIIIFGGG